MAASLQLSMDSFKRILEFDPADNAFNISTINTKLNHLFVIATNGQRTISEPECIQHTLTAYACIKKPEEWAQWVGLQIDSFEEGIIPNAQSLMNSAALKYVKISANGSSSFGGSSTTISEDILSMMAAVSKKLTVPPTSKKKIATKFSEDEPNPKSAKTLPPFVRHFKKTTASDSATFKVGDTKEWKGDTWYFCNCPNHRDCVKWHYHTAPECRTHQKWLNDEDGSAPTAAIADSDRASTVTYLTDPSTSSDSSDITSILASALSLATGN